MKKKKPELKIPQLKDGYRIIIETKDRMHVYNCVNVVTEYKYAVEPTRMYSHGEFEMPPQEPYALEIKAILGGKL